MKRCPLIFTVCLALLPQAARAQQDGASRVDLYGDPLPPGAIARLGTVRLRHGFGILALAWFPDGKSVVAADVLGDVVRWDVASGKELLRFPKASGGMHKALALSPDGKLLALTGGNDEYVCLYVARTGKRICKPVQGAEWIHALAFSPDSKLLAWGSYDKKVHLWDVATGKEIRPLTGLEIDTGFLAFMPDGKSILIGTVNGFEARTGVLVQKDLASDKELRRIVVDREGAGRPAESGTVCALSLDGKAVAALGEKRTLRLWRLDSGKEAWRIKANEGEAPKESYTKVVRTVVFSPDGKLLAVAHWDRGKRTVGHVSLRDAASGRELRRLDGLGPVEQMAFSPDSKTLVCQSKNKGVWLLETATGKERGRLQSEGDVFEALTFSPDGRWLLYADGKGVIRVWSPATGREVCRLAGHRGPVKHLAFSAAGRYLASASDDCTALVWDLRRLLPVEKPPPTAKELEQLWSDLASQDAGRVYGAIHRLSAAGPPIVK